MDKENENKHIDEQIDEGARVKMQGHLLIRDAETGEELVNKRNAILLVIWLLLLQMQWHIGPTENNGIYSYGIW